MTRFLMLLAGLAGAVVTASNASAADYWTSAAQREQIHQQYLTPAEHAALHQGLGNTYGTGYGTAYGNSYANPYGWGMNQNQYTLPSNSSYGWNSNYGMTNYGASYAPAAYGTQYHTGYRAPVRSPLFGTSNTCQPCSNRPYGW